MFNNHKCIVTSNMNNTNKSNSSEYNKKVNEVKNANLQLDSSTHNYLDMISEFPKMKVEMPQELRSEKLHINFIGMLFVDVTINNRKLKMLFDTGAQISCINNKIFDFDIGVQDTLKKIKVGDSNGIFEDVELALTDELKVLGIKISNLPMLAIDKNKLSLKLLGKTIFDIDGIIGWDIMSLVDFEIDYSNKNIKLLSDKSMNSQRNFIESDFPAVIVSDVSGKLGVFGLDTGARKSWLSKQLVLNSKLTYKPFTHKIRGVHGRASQTEFLVEEYKIYIDNHLIKFENINTGYTKLLNNYEFDGVLGLDIMKKHTISILNSKGVMKFK